MDSGKQFESDDVDNYKFKLSSSIFLAYIVMVVTLLCKLVESFGLSDSLIILH